MAQKYKVFINDKAVFFHITEDNANIISSDCALVSNNAQEIDQFIISNNMYDGDLHIFGLNCFDNYFDKYTKIDAAGGLVENNTQEFLFIFRLNKWDLPKGKVEKGEKLEEAAIREVKEECGIDNLRLVEHLITTYHTYSMFGKTVLKSTYWYKMESNFDGKLIPQLEEDITKVEWRSKNDLAEVKENTYKSILDVLGTISSRH